MSGPLSTEKERNDSNHSSTEGTNDLGGRPRWAPSHRRYRRRYRDRRIHKRLRRSHHHADELDNEEEDPGLSSSSQSPGCCPKRPARDQESPRNLPTAPRGQRFPRVNDHSPEHLPRQRIHGRDQQRPTHLLQERLSQQRLLRVAQHPPLRLVDPRVTRSYLF